MHSDNKTFGGSPDVVLLEAAGKVGGAAAESKGEKKEFKALPTSKDTIVSQIERSGQVGGVKRELLTFLSGRDGKAADLERILFGVTDPLLANKIRTYFNVTRVLQQKLEDRDLELTVASTKAFQDHLTGLANPRFIQAALEAEVSRYRRGNEPHNREGVDVKGAGELFAIMFDVDHFKGINDKYGHPFGDEVLKALAEVLRGVFKRKTDVVGRKGGEEFLVLAWCNSKDDALMLANKVREMFAAKKLKYNGGGEEVGTTVSVGVAACKVGMAPGDLVSVADSALYAAKGDKIGDTNGRNRVVFADKSDPVYRQSELEEIAARG
jgi:diguanylate cyclase (GGDEF)-like protein